MHDESYRSNSTGRSLTWRPPPHGRPSNMSLGMVSPMHFELSWLFSWCSKRPYEYHVNEEAMPEPQPHGYQLYPPPPPQAILASRSEY